jgi:riboflavin synthase
VFSGIIECVGKVGAGVASEVTPTHRTVFAGSSSGHRREQRLQTVAARRGSTFTMVVSAESLRRSTLGSLRPATSVNLERSLRVSDRLSRHFVFGHVPQHPRVDPPEAGAPYRFLARGFARFLVEKGSIAVEGVSLTVFDCGRHSFTVSLIPIPRRRPSGKCVPGGT